MADGTLIVSRAVNLHALFRKTLEVLGFNDITATDVEKNSLIALIRNLKPDILIIESTFYKCSTPYMTADLHRQFPKLNIAAVSISDYPDDLAVHFIVNGARSYVSFREGDKQFYKDLDEIRQGREYVSPEVQKRIDMMDEYPEPARELTERQAEIIRLVANGFTGKKIAGTLGISERSVDSRKSEIYTAMNVRNENEAIRAAICLGIIKPDELHFFSRDYELKPKIKKKYKEKRPSSRYCRTASPLQINADCVFSK